MKSEDVGRWIEVKLKEQGISQSNLCRRSGITRSTLSAIIKGTRSPGLNTFISIADALGYDLKIVKKG